MSFWDDGDEGGDDESGCFPPTFTPFLLLLLLYVSVKSNSMQISQSEDKIPVSTAVSIRRHSVAFLGFSLSLISNTVNSFPGYFTFGDIVANSARLFYGKLTKKLFKRTI